MFGLDIPECKPFKVAYEDCFKENVQSKLSSWVFDPAAAAQCEEPFLVSINYFFFVMPLI